MRRICIAAIGFLGAAGLLAGCENGSMVKSAASTTRPTTEPFYASVSSGVRAAFAAEHPYDKMDHPTMLHAADGSTQYKVPYIHPDGTRGQAIYSEDGVLVDGQ